MSWSSIPHPPTEDCDPWHCAWHDIDEQANGYRVCGECLHTFPTAADLVWDYWYTAPRGIELDVKTADEIWFCPWCAHDF